jgi:hypothetical protein
MLFGRVDQRRAVQGDDNASGVVAKTPTSTMVVVATMIGRDWT